MQLRQQLLDILLVQMVGQNDFECVAHPHHCTGWRACGSVEGFSRLAPCWPALEPVRAGRRPSRGGSGSSVTPLGSSSKGLKILQPTTSPPSYHSPRPGRRAAVSGRSVSSVTTVESSRGSRGTDLRSCSGNQISASGSGSRRPPGVRRLGGGIVRDRPWRASDPDGHHSSTGRALVDGDVRRGAHLCRRRCGSVRCSTRRVRP